MAVGPDPAQPDEGEATPSGDSSMHDAASGLDRGGARTALIEQIARAQTEPPAGLVLVGWELPSTGSQPDPVSDRQVERSVAFSVAGCAGRSDRILASAEAEMAVVCSSLSRPASAESLAHRIAQKLDVELERLGVEADEPTARWAIGVAVGHASDRPQDLLRYAEAALNDAWLLGGRRLVAFDDGNRELLNRPIDTD